MKLHYKVLTTLAKNWLSDESSGLSKEEKLLLTFEESAFAIKGYELS